MKIKHPLVKGKVKYLQNNIYCVIVDDDYDRAMLFCRYQEFYESSNKNFRGKYFSWEEYMRYYKNLWKKDTFTYPIDWAGYNIPSTIFEKANDVFNKQTEYDKIMNDIFYYCHSDTMNRNDGTRKPFYIVGTGSKDIKTMNHEVAHGLFFTNKDYRMRILYQLSLIPKKTMDKIDKKLIKMGYVNDRKILDDEAQAFLCTGLYNGLEIKEIKKYEKPFIKIFKEYSHV